jgi:hypothetical protein
MIGNKFDDLSSRIISPSMLFVLIVIIFNIIPSTVILLTDYIPVREALSARDFKESKEIYFFALCLFFCTFLTGRLFISLVINGKLKLFSRYKGSRIEVKSYFQAINKITIGVFILCVLLISLYAVNGGIEKLLLLGGDINGREFRFMGFDDIDRFYTAGLAISRRFLLPIIIIILYLRFRYGDKKVKLWLIFAIIIQLFASTLTFARAPFLTLLVGLFTVRIMTEKSKKRMFFQMFILLLGIVLMAGVVTSLQYNITNNSLEATLLMGGDFLTNRTWFVPNVVPIRLVFADEILYSNPLFLQHSRLSGLFTGEVVGTAEDFSKYVAPVGYIGDIWRNFSWAGLVLFGVLSSVLFAHLDALSARLSIVGVSIFMFLMLAMIFYWIMGVVFSQGAIFSIFLIYVFIYLDKILLRKIGD